MDSEIDIKYQMHLGERDELLAQITADEVAIKEAKIRIIEAKRDLLKIAARVEILEEDGATLIREESEEVTPE